MRSEVLNSNSTAYASETNWRENRAPLISAEQRGALRAHAASVYADLEAQGMALDGSGRVLDFPKYTEWLKASMSTAPGQQPLTLAKPPYLTLRK